MLETTWEVWDQPETISRGEAIERLHGMPVAERRRADHLWASLATATAVFGADLGGSALPEIHNPFWCWDVGLADLAAELPSETMIICGVTLSHADLRPRLSWRLRIPIPEKEDGVPLHTDETLKANLDRLVRRSIIPGWSGVIFAVSTQDLSTSSPVRRDEAIQVLSEMLEEALLAHGGMSIDHMWHLGTVDSPHDPRLQMIDTMRDTFADEIGLATFEALEDQSDEPDTPGVVVMPPRSGKTSTPEQVAENPPAEHLLRRDRQAQQAGEGQTQQLTTHERLRRRLAERYGHTPDEEQRPEAGRRAGLDEDDLMRKLRGSDPEHEWEGPGMSDDIQLGEHRRGPRM